MHSIDDAGMRAAAADVALQKLRDVGGGGTGIALQEADAADDHAGSAISALERAGIDEGLLHRMQATVFLKTFNGGDRLPYRGAEGNLAGPARLAAKQPGARAALPSSPAIFAARETEFVSQAIYPRRSLIVTPPHPISNPST